MLAKDTALHRLAQQENDLEALIAAAHYASQEEKWNIALNLYNRIARDTQEDWVYKAIAEIYIKLKRGPIAAIYYDAYLSKQPEKVKENGIKEKIKILLDEFLKANPKVVEVQLKYVKNKSSKTNLEQRKKFHTACHSGKPNIAYEIGKLQYIKNCVDPDIQNVWCSLAIRNGDAQGALTAAFCAYVNRPSDWIALVNIADILLQLKRLTHILDYAIAAVNIQPKSPVAWMNLGATWEVLQQSWESAQATEKALKLDPNNASAWTNLGNAYKNSGDLVKALPAYREAVKLDPHNNLLWSNLLFGILYDPLVTNIEIAQEHLEFGKTIELKNKVGKIRKIKKNTEKIRIGFVSADLRAHPVAYFVEPLLVNINKNDFSIYVYDNHHTEDLVVERLKTYTDKWTKIADKTDLEVIDFIWEDQIDVLVDLSGHTAKNRLDLFAKKPVDLQITWLGHPNTTGLTRIDYRLTDKYLDPDGNESLYTEKLYRLPIHAAYIPLIRSPEMRTSLEFSVKKTPALNNKYITFGSCNNLAKISSEVIQLWSEILLNIPYSKLLIEAPGLNQNEYKNNLLKKFNNYGITSERLILHNRVNAMQYKRYNEIDIALDPFPYGGGTSTCDLLWMGVPLVSLEGERVMSRTGVCFLTLAGHKEWIASNKNDYKNIAFKLASNIEFLNDIRMNLRREVENSLIMNGKEFAYSFEEAITKMLTIKTGDDYINKYYKSKDIAATNSKKIMEYNNILRHADLLMSESKWTEALKTFEFLRDYEGAEPNALFGIGLCSFHLGDPQRSMRIIVDALLRKKEPTWLLWLGRVYDKLNLDLPLYVVAYWLFINSSKITGVNELYKKANIKINHQLNLRKLAIPTDADKLNCNKFISENNKIALLLKENKNEEALNLGEELLIIHQYNQPLLINVALAAKRLKNYEKAARWYLIAFVLDPLGYGAITNFGNLLVTVNSSQDAMLILEAGAIVMNQDSLLWSNLAVAYNSVAVAPWEAEIAASKAIELDASIDTSWIALGKALSRQGRMDEAIKAFNKGYELNPSNKGGDVFTLQYSDKISRAEIADIHFLVGKKIEIESAGKVFKEYNKSINKDKKLIIGFVTGDLTSHPVAYFMDKIFKFINKKNFEIIIYNTRPCKDEDLVSNKFKLMVDKWFDVSEVNDDLLALKINKDSVDILCDLAGHTAYNRLGVFGRKPSPVQFTYLGHPNTTGLKSIDWRIVDGYTSQEGDEIYYSEKLWKLPDAHCVYSPLIRDDKLQFDTKYTSKISPAINNGFVTFGCCNNLAKISPDVVKLWSEILLKVENSKLLIESPGLHQKEFKKSIISRFGEHGIRQERLILINRVAESQYVIYNQIDIALDPFPYNGGTTTCDLLWFGIPLVTLVGKTEVGRLGYSFVNNIGYPQWAASTKDEYIKIAVEMSSDISNLNLIRLQLREKVENSPLMNGERFTQNFENALRGMWEYYVDSIE